MGSCLRGGDDDDDVWGAVLERLVRMVGGGNMWEAALGREVLIFCVAGLKQVVRISELREDS